MVCKGIGGMLAFTGYAMSIFLICLPAAASAQQVEPCHEGIGPAADDPHLLVSEVTLRPHSQTWLPSALRPRPTLCVYIPPNITPKNAYCWGYQNENHVGQWCEAANGMHPANTCNSLPYMTTTGLDYLPKSRQICWFVSNNSDSTRYMKLKIKY
jgi:hypothetical protein